MAHLLGIYSSFDALMSTRTSQGAIAWILSLNTLPVLSVPAYWIFGRDKFEGYSIARAEIDELSQEHQDALRKLVEPYVREVTEAGSGGFAGLKLAEMPFLGSNAVELLIDGEATFDSIFAGIDEAEDYVLVQFYIVHDDELGRALKERLLAKAAEGVPVYFLYDEIGTRGLEDYWKELTDAGVSVTPFNTTRGPSNRFQLNFRNHRKIVVVDGKTGWVGGHNVGDEYMGRDPEFPNWRDTHMKLTGPAVLELQLSFLEDWRWATDDLVELSWQPVPAEEGDATVLILPTGPADRLETCSLMYQQAIHSAKERIWIASPYFVPDDGVISALHLAALRGVDVRIIIPEISDNFLVYYSAYAFVGELLESGIEIYRYQPGFMHQKVFLVDDILGGVGTANFDNRSFRLNFEVTALVSDEQFVEDMEAMFEADMEKSERMAVVQLEAKPIWFRALSRLCYLAAPVQ
ncbi:MAG: cardiolipin synthase [Planctomycetaceae bacterium]|nr:cardiolipin synthase [Planctomycetaceae bacterium]